MKEDIIKVLKEFKEKNSKKYMILSLGIFGSCARGDENSESDIDIFVQTEIPDPFLLVHIKDELEELFNTPVDIIRLRDNMNPYLKKRILNEGIYV